MAAWNDDTAREEEMTQRDLLILEKLADVLEISSKRSGVVEHVSEDMNTELNSLSTFLDTVADRRPKGRCLLKGEVLVADKRPKGRCVLKGEVSEDLKVGGS